MTKPQDLTPATTTCRTIQEKERVDFVVELILDGNTREEVSAMIMKAWGISKNHANSFIDKATVKVQHVFDQRFESKASGLISSLQRVYRDALANGEYKSAIEAIKAIASIQGMDKKVVETHNKTDITVKDAEDFKDLSTKDLIKIVHSS